MLDPARARVLLYGLQIAATNARHMASNAGTPTEETERPEKKTTDVKHPATSPTTSKPHEPQPVRIDEHAQELMKSEDTAAITKHDARAEVEETVAPTQPTPHAGHLRIPPSCFSSANDYSSGSRDRLLAARERARLSSVV
jgi:outer membrane biosynthesis protein TonB